MAGQYFDAEPAVPSRPTPVTLTLPDATIEMQTDRGVFSTEGVDAGTKYLLLDGPPPPSTGDLLDLGCGYGPIALTLARRSPGATVWAVDVNGRALDLCRANAERLGLANVRVAAPDDVPAGTRFASIWSNPPIRIGKDALHDLLARWLGQLAEGGWAALVVSKHLGSDSLATWLGAQRWSVERLGSRQGYRILRVAAALPEAGEPA